VHESAAEPHPGVREQAREARRGRTTSLSCCLVPCFAARPSFSTPRKRMHILAKRFSERPWSAHGAGS